MAAIVAVALLPIGSYLALLIAWLALLALALVARIGAWRLPRSGFIAAPFLVAALPVVFLRPEDPLGTIDIGLFAVTISGEGLRIFTTIALKSWISVQAALLLTFTTPFHDLVDALRRLRMPRIMVAIISFMYRYLAVVGGEASRMLRARSARSAEIPGRRAGGSLRWRAGVAGSMVGSLFLRSYERSERIYAAMQARGFEGTFRHFHGRGISGVEWTVYILIAACLIAFVTASQLWLPLL